jgi:hypothetical protein
VRFSRSDGDRESERDMKGVMNWLITFMPARKDRRGTRGLRGLLMVNYTYDEGRMRGCRDENTQL